MWWCFVEQGFPRAPESRTSGREPQGSKTPAPIENRVRSPGTGLYHNLQRGASVQMALPLLYLSSSSCSYPLQIN